MHLVKSILSRAAMMSLTSWGSSSSGAVVSASTLAGQGSGHPGPLHYEQPQRLLGFNACRAVIREVPAKPRALQTGHVGSVPGETGVLDPIRTPSDPFIICQESLRD